MEFDSRHNGQTVLSGERIRDEPVILNGCTDVTIIDCDFSFNKQGNAMLTLENCKDCKILKSKFHDKTTEGNFIKIIGKKSKKNLIEGCIFRKHTYSKGNGGEPVRIGESPDSGRSFRTKVRYCRFEKLEADPETVSIKSCYNTLEHNEHIDCDSNFTIRHGGFNKILNNKFTGSGGIRVYGRDNEIRGNYHKGNNNENKKRRPLWIGNANLKNDINFDNDGRPSDPPEDGCRHAGYARTRNNIMEDNTYHECKGPCVVWGVETYPTRVRKRCPDGTSYVRGALEIPENNKFRNNTLIAERQTSSFLRFSSSNTYNKAKEADNTLRRNKMYGRNANRDELKEKDVEILSEMPTINIPEAGPEALSAITSQVLQT
jgi:hypothetical protein